MNLMLHDLVAALPAARIIGPADIAITGLAYDSRAVRAGSLFVAIKGFHVDGHAFVRQAVERGAAAIVVDERYWTADPGLGQEKSNERQTTDIAAVPGPPSVVIVPDSRSALAPLAAACYGHPGRELGVVGITGTKGKSTTVDITSRLLEGGGRRTGMISTVDFKVGPRRWANSTRQSTPEAPEVQALLREMVAAGCDYAVVEATSHALAAGWNRLGGCAFDVAVFLNIGHEHLDYHGTFAQYRADKMRLFELLGEEEPGTEPALSEACPERSRRAEGNREPSGAVPAKQQKWAIANADDPHHHLFLAAAPPAARRLTFGIRAAADVRGLDVMATPDGAHFRVATPWGEAPARLALPGTFNVQNALAALSVALSQGVALERAVAALAQAPGVRGRMERIDAGQPFAVIVDYAHNPDSFTQIMGMLRPLTAGRLIAVFGSAGERDRAKRPLQGAIAARYCDLLVLTDEDPRGEDRAAIIAEIAAGVTGCPYLSIPDRATAIRAAFAEARPGDLVLLLGKGHEECIIYADHQIPWDEAAEARQALSEMGY